MSTILRIGIIDDDSSKVTQIITKLSKGIEGASVEKKKKYSQFTFEPYEIELKENLQEVIDQITEHKIQGILLDYNLSSFANVDYTGIELANALEDMLYDFPIFVLTAYDDDLFTNEIFNAYQVFDFERYLSEESECIELHFKIIEQILKNQKQKENWEKELKDLLPYAGTSEKVDSRLLELDSKLEKTIDGKHSLSDKAKKDLSSNKLIDLLNKLDDILEKE